MVSEISGWIKNGGVMGVGLSYSMSANTDPPSDQFPAHHQPD